MRRLPPDQLFRIGREGLEDISDATLEVRVTESERATLRRQADEGYQAATVDEMLQLPEST
jgi:hypothetical protein